MKGSRRSLWTGCAVAALTMACASQPPAEPTPAAEQEAAPAAEPAAASNRQAEFGRFPDREFLRLPLDKFQWRATEGNTLGVQTAVLEGDPSKPGFYLTINRFPPGVMSRPHYHPDERNIIGDQGHVVHGRRARTSRRTRRSALKPGEYMRHPAGGPHYDGALDEEVWVAISGYGPTSATILDGGELFGKSR